MMLLNVKTMQYKQKSRTLCTTKIHGKKNITNKTAMKQSGEKQIKAEKKS